MKIGTNIKKRRVAQGLTQEQLAEKLYVTRQTVSSWERAASNPDLEQLEAIAGALETDVTGLLYGPQPRPRPSRRQVAGTVGLALLVLVMCLACWKLGPWRSRHMRHHELYAYYFYYFYLSLTAFLGGWAVLAVAALRWHLSLEGRERRVCLVVGLVLLAVAVGSLTLQWLLYAQDILPWWLGRLAYLLLNLCVQYLLPILAIPAGGLLYLACHPAGRGKEPA